MRPQKSPRYWLFGHHAVTAALANPRRTVRRIAALQQAEVKSGPRHPKVERVDKGFFEKTLERGAVHQGIAAEVDPLPDIALEDVIKGDRPLILLDQVTDPHNVGAILRSAAAFDAAAVVVTADHAPPETATLAKAASGALEIMPLVRIVNLAQAIEKIKKGNYWVAGLDGEAPTLITQAKLNAKTALVMGAEGRGLRRLTGERCDVLIKLPISDRMESLNVSNAAAIALYELCRAS